MKLPVDHLIEQMRLPKDLIRKTNTMCLAILKNLIPLELVKNTTIMKAALDYIARLLKDKYNLGYLYYLHSMNKRMLIPLDVEFNGELAIEKARFDQVVEEFDKLSSEFAPRDTFIFDITRVELLYFFYYFNHSRFDLDCRQPHSAMRERTCTFYFRTKQNYEK
ncbi:hypothetical protein AVEN_122116-1 [Araneus ventricosus]|uniref:Uncharacterized protein n=1 Tax=Araneus ventricosus TaxID=182803 RepID=A0A4Y2WM25_ARAVE|nr:hypothetical protein AVEN_122116-1 [Araneus ventricosus]